MADNKVVITREFNAPVEKVWAAFTEPEQMKKWWGPKDFTAPFVTVDFRVGGKYLYAMHGPTGTQFDIDMWNTGTYEEIVPLQKIIYSDNFSDENGNVVPPSTYGMDDFPQPMRVQIEFEQLPEGKTKLTLTHDGVPSAEHATNMEMGWNQSLDRMATSL